MAFFHAFKRSDSSGILNEVRLLSGARMGGQWPKAIVGRFHALALIHSPSRFDSGI